MRVDRGNVDDENFISLIALAGIMSVIALFSTVTSALPAYESVPGSQEVPSWREVSGEGFSDLG